ncbi:MAG: sugar phosphate isomerase/epimerase [Cyclobacteriaceae bacterium]|jgi:sugar phosphate isomerase/epimerase
MNNNRRSFLKSAGLVSAGIAFLPSCISSSNNSKKMDVGVQLYTVRDAMDKDPMGTLAKVAKIGYNQIETAGYSDGKVYGFEGKEIRKILGDLDLQFISGHIPLPDFRDNFDRVLDFMNEAGQQYAVLPWLQEDQRVSIDQYKGYAELLNINAEKAKSSGKVVCYHNHDFEFWNVDGEIPMQVLLNETDPELVKFELDLYWVHKADQNAATIFKENQGRFPLWHVKDMADTKERGFVEVGTGTIDYKAMFELKKESGMKYFFVEQDQSDDPMKSIETSYKNLTEDIL